MTNSIAERFPSLMRVVVYVPETKVRLRGHVTGGETKKKAKFVAVGKSTGATLDIGDRNRRTIKTRRVAW